MLRLFKLDTADSLVVFTIQEIIAKVQPSSKISWLGYSLQLKEYPDVRIFALY